jgi:serine/threonine protein kinase
MSDPRASEAPTDVAVGTLIAGRYRVGSLLGEGGMARVFEATKIADEATVVIKIPRRLSDTATARFQREVEAISRVSHPAIVQVLEAGIDPGLGSPFMVLERVIGRSLGELVRRDGPFTEDRAKQILSEIAAGLAAAHKESILHRDLTPQNVMLDDADRVRILDFGLAKILDSNRGPPLTQPLTTLGTPAFMSPEQITGRSLDGRSDLYALGCLAHFLLSGRAPFDGQDHLSVMRAHLERSPPSLPATLADGRPPSPSFERLVLQLLAKAPSDRPNDAMQVALQLRPAITGTLPPPESEESIRTDVLLRSRGDDFTAVVPKDLDANESGTTGGGSTRLLGPAHKTTMVLEPKPRPVWPWLIAIVPLGIIAGISLFPSEQAPIAPTRTPQPTPTRPQADPQTEPQVVPVPREVARIISDPTGAEVYAGARSLGRTPLELERAALPADVEIRAEGRSSVKLRVERPGDIVVALPLLPASEPPKKRPPPSKKDPGEEVPIW